jgi:hypothetical protein
MDAPTGAAGAGYTGREACVFRMVSLMNKLRASVRVRLQTDVAVLRILSSTSNVAEALRTPLQTVRDMHAFAPTPTLELLERYCRLRDMYDFARTVDPRGATAIARLRDAAVNGRETEVLAMLSAGVHPLARHTEDAESPFDATVSACEALCGPRIFDCRHAAVRCAFFDVMDPGGCAVSRVLLEYGWVRWDARAQPSHALAQPRASTHKASAQPRVAVPPHPSAGEPLRRSTRKRRNRQTCESANEDDLDDEDYTPH